MKYAIKIEYILDEQNKNVLDGQSRICNWAFNHLLKVANDLKKDFIKTGDKTLCKTIYTQRGLRNLLPKLKDNHLFLKSVHSSPLKNSALRLSQSIKNYQDFRKGKRTGTKVGWPRFRSFKRSYFSLLYDEPNKGFRVSGSFLTLSLGVNEKGERLKVAGRLKNNLSKFKDIEIKNLRVTKSGERYFAVFTVEKIAKSTREIKKVASIDPNHKNLGYVVGSDGRAMEIANPYFLKNLQRRIDKLKSRRDRCLRKAKKVELKNDKFFYLPSRRYQKFDEILKRVLQLRRDQTKTYLFTLANKLYKEYDLVGIGDYTPRGGGLGKKMRRSMNNESLIGRFKETLSWVAKRGGKGFEIWNEHNTTKTCSTPGCKFIHKKSLDPSIRSWKCPSCKITHIRDENAAKNGLKKLIKKLPCLGHLEEEIRTRCAWRFDGLGVQSLEFRGPSALETLIVGQDLQEIKPAM